MGKRRKQRKAAVDRDVISRLPDEILIHILSFLPTRTSVATSVLSRRWRYLWKKVQVLDLNDDFLYTPERSHEEAQERFLILLEEFERLLHPIRKFRVSCRANENGYTDILDWIDYVIHRVSELHFSMRTDGQSYRLPSCYIGSTSLVSLVLDGNIDIFLEDFSPSDIIFPPLKNLELHINYLNLDVFLSGCPALETLRVTLIKFRSEDTLYLDPEAIHMPRSLKTLTFEEQYSHSENVTICFFGINIYMICQLFVFSNTCHKC